MGFTQWQFDSSRQKHFYYDPDQTCYIYEDGSRIPNTSQTEQNQGAETQSSPERTSAESRDPTLSRGSDSTLVPDISGLSLREKSSSSEIPGTVHPQGGSYGQNSPQPAQGTYKSHSSHTRIDSQQIKPPASAYSLSGHYQAYAGAESSSSVQGSNQASGVQVAAEPSDGERLQEVNREVEDLAPNSKLLRATPGQEEKLDPSFKVLRPGYSYFKRGIVFRVLWPELLGDRARENATIATANSRFTGEKFFVKIRWFVVVREGNDCCTCLSIQTYGHRGVPKNKVKHHHAIIYTGSFPPDPVRDELPTGPSDLPMGDPIRVVAHRLGEKLDPLSRVNFLKLYTVEHNVKVQIFGEVDPEHEWNLISQYNSHWQIQQSATHPLQYSTHAHAPPPALHSSQVQGYQSWPQQMATATEHQPTPQTAWMHSTAGNVTQDYQGSGSTIRQPQMYPGSGSAAQQSQMYPATGSSRWSSHVHPGTGYTGQPQSGYQNTGYTGGLQPTYPGQPTIMNTMQPYHQGQFSPGPYPGQGYSSYDEDNPPHTSGQ